jgi:6-pyruvoyltetrahydropterin/6-carboxytetrahydropterin synthase
MHSVTRYHDISCGHRVHGHESKCAHLHGHNYRVHFTCAAAPESLVKLDGVGRVIDFGVIKAGLCQWLEDNWDHKFLVGAEDPLWPYLKDIDSNGVVRVPFNPTAENMAEYLVRVIGPMELVHTGVVLVRVKIEETAKCSATYALEDVF